MYVLLRILNKNKMNTNLEQTTKKTLELQKEKEIEVTSIFYSKFK